MNPGKGAEMGDVAGKAIEACELEPQDLEANRIEVNDIEANRTEPPASSETDEPEDHLSSHPLLGRTDMPTQQPDSATAHPLQQPAPAPPPAPRSRRLSRLLWLGGLVGLAGLAIPVLYSWWSSRLDQSITEDAFVEAHVVNIAPQTVSGHLVRFSVAENDHVEQGQVL